MRIEVDGEGTVDDFVVVEDGEYQMRVAGAKEMHSVDGRISWMLRLELVEGDLAGRTAVTDWLNFNVRGLSRVRMVLAALGFDVTDTLDIEPAELLGRKAFIRLTTEETTRASDQRVQRRSRVDYDGWSPVSAAEAAKTPLEAQESSSAGSAGGSFAAGEMPF